MRAQERKQLQRDINLILDTEFAGEEFIPTISLVRALRDLGNPSCRDRTDGGVASIISHSTQACVVQRRMQTGKRVRGYYVSDIYGHDHPECCIPGSPLYKYRHVIITHARGRPGQYDCQSCYEERAVHWATIHGTCPRHDPYTDYYALCVKCHSRYDSGDLELQEPEAAVPAAQHAASGVSGNFAGLREAAAELTSAIRELTKLVTGKKEGQ